MQTVKKGTKYSSELNIDNRKNAAKQLPFSASAVSKALSISLLSL